jgi:hypothetical protein
MDETSCPRNLATESERRRPDRTVTGQTYAG